MAWKKARKTLVEKIGKEADIDIFAVSDLDQVKSAINKSSEKFFKEVDTDGNNGIDPQELKSAFDALGVALTMKETTRMLREADQDG